MSLHWVVYEYEDVFLDELSGLPPYSDIDFMIELHLGTFPISMNPHRMMPIELQELKVQLQDLLDRGLLDQALHLGALQCYFQKRKTRHFDYA